MLAAQKTKPKQLHMENEKYGRRNWTEAERRSQVTAETRQSFKPSGRLFGLVAIIMIGLVCIVLVSAYSAQIRYNINKINKDISSIRAEAEALTLTLDRERNIMKVESKAIELGMRYPDVSEKVFLVNTNQEDEAMQLAKQ